MKHIHSILCQKSIIDKDTNSVSLINCVEQINVPPSMLPAERNANRIISLPVDIEIVSLWQRENADKELRNEAQIILIDPKGEKLKEFDYNFVIEKNKLKMRTRITLRNIAFSRPGDYEFEVNFKNNSKYKKVATIPVTIAVGKAVVK